MEVGESSKAARDAYLEELRSTLEASSKAGVDPHFYNRHKPIGTESYSEMSDKQLEAAGLLNFSLEERHKAIRTEYEARQSRTPLISNEDVVRKLAECREIYKSLDLNWLETALATADVNGVAILARLDRWSATMTEMFGENWREKHPRLDPDVTNLSRDLVNATKGGQRIAERVRNDIAKLFHNGQNCMDSIVEYWDQRPVR